MKSELLVCEMEGGGGTLHLRVSRFSFWIAKLSESSASRIV